MGNGSTFKREVPGNFTEIASQSTMAELARLYDVSKSVVRRWSESTQIMLLRRCATCGQLHDTYRPQDKGTAPCAICRNTDPVNLQRRKCNKCGETKGKTSYRKHSKVCRTCQSLDEREGRQEVFEMPEFPMPATQGLAYYGQGFVVNLQEIAA